MKNLRNKVKNLLASKVVKRGLKKQFGGKEFIIDLGFAAVAIFLLIIYRDGIGVFLKDLMSWVTNLVKNLFTNL